MFWQSTVLFSFCMFHCNKVSKIHDGPLFTYLQFLASDVSAAPCFNHLYLALLLSQPDFSFRSLRSPLRVPSYFFTLPLVHPFGSSLRLFTSWLLFFPLCICGGVCYVSVHFLLERPRQWTCCLLLSISQDLRLDCYGGNQRWRRRRLSPVFDYCCYVIRLLQYYVYLEALLVHIFLRINLLIRKGFIFFEIYHCLTLSQYLFTMTKPLG